MTDDNPDYVTLMPAADPHKFLVALMTYVSSQDEYVIKKISEYPMREKLATFLAEAWAKTHHVEIRGLRPVNTVVEQAVNDYSRRTFSQLVDEDPHTQACISNVVAVLDEFPAHIQAKALPIVLGMLWAEVEGQATMADLLGGSFVTFEDHKRVAEVLMQKAYERVQQEKPQQARM